MIDIGNQSGLVDALRFRTPEGGMFEHEHLLLRLLTHCGVEGVLVIYVENDSMDVEIPTKLPK